MHRLVIPRNLFINKIIHQKSIYVDRFVRVRVNLSIYLFTFKIGVIHKDISCTLENKKKHRHKQMEGQKQQREGWGMDLEGVIGEENYKILIVIEFKISNY
jgi:hypothetical protein